MKRSKRKPKGIIAKCIYCSEIKEMSQEHYVPEGLGKFKNFETLDDRICIECNNAFGRKIEEQFLRCGEIGFMRHALGIKGKKHHDLVNPFLRGSAGMRAYDMKAKMLGKDEEVLFQIVEGTSNDVVYIPQMKFTTYEDEVHYIRIPPDMTEPSALLEELKKRGIGKFKEVYVLVPTGERERIDKLIAALKIQKPGEWGETPTSVEKVRVDAITKYDVDDRFFRGVAKIGFHYLLKHHYYHGNEDMFSEIRDFIMNGSDMKKFITFDSNEQIIKAAQNGYTPDNYCHVVAAQTTPKGIFSRMQFFLGPDVAIPRPYTVTLSTHESALYSIIGHHYSYYPEGAKAGFLGEEQKIDSDMMLIMN